MLGIYLAQNAGRVCIHHTVGLPAAHADHFVSCGKTGMAAFHHFADRAADHHAVERLRQGIAFHIVHATAHVGVEAQVFVFHQNLLVLQRGSVQGEQLKIFGKRFTLGAADQMDLRIVWHAYLQKC
jgi:hypothetical protein